jgi:hypothetical protein
MIHEVFSDLGSTPQTTLQTTRGQIHGLSSQLTFKRYLPEVGSVGD